MFLGTPMSTTVLPCNLKYCHSLCSLHICVTSPVIELKIVFLYYHAAVYDGWIFCSVVADTVVMPSLCHLRTANYFNQLCNEYLDAFHIGGVLFYSILMSVQYGHTIYTLTSFKLANTLINALGFVSSVH